MKKIFLIFTIILLLLIASLNMSAQNTNDTLDSSSVFTSMKFKKYINKPYKKFHKDILTKIGLDKIESIECMKNYDIFIFGLRYALRNGEVITLIFKSEIKTQRGPCKYEEVKEIMRNKCKISAIIFYNENFEDEIEFGEILLHH